MGILKKISPALPLRLGLGLMYLYSGYDLIANPFHWYGFVPRWFSGSVAPVISLEQYLRLQGAVEIALGVLLLAWFLPGRLTRIAAAAAAAEMAGILLFVGIDPITFRDIGLLGATVALLILMSLPSSSHQ